MKWSSLNLILINEATTQIPRSYLYFGFTTLIDLFSNKTFIDNWNAQAIRPDAHFCIGAPIANGYPFAWLPIEERFSGDFAQFILYDERQDKNIPEHIKPAQHSPTAVVNKIKEAGAICVKTFYEEGFGRLKNLPNPTQDMMTELVHAANKNGLKVFMHGNSQKAYEFGNLANVDILAHGMWHWNEKRASNLSARINKLVDDIVNKQIAYQPTIQVIAGEQELFNEQYFSQPSIKHVMPESLISWYQSTEGGWMREEMAKNIGKNLHETTYLEIKKSYTPLIRRLNKLTASMANKNAKLIFGSDTPSGPFYTQFPGLNGYLEIQYLADAGVPLHKILRALTIDNATALGLDKDIGTIEPGKVANLLLLKENPLIDAKAYDSIDTVILRGVLHQREVLSAKHWAI